MVPMTWFEGLTGFSEISPQQVHANLLVDGNKLTSRANGKTYICGELEIPTLGELRERANSCSHLTGPISIREVVANVQGLHADKANAGSLFQVASQFNLLEMVGPSITPEHGVGIYEHDHTQGPACAIAAGAGTIYRNYFANVNGQVGQSAGNQVDCLSNFGAALGNSDGHLWQTKNGYALATRDGSVEISNRLKTSSESKLDELRQLLRIGIQWNTQVTLNGCQHCVTQAYCSALPVGYSNQPSSLWKEFAQLILEAAYEATFCAAILNSTRNGNNKLFLTLLGGGAFGNDMACILAAMRHALNLYKNASLEVMIVSYGSSNWQVQELLQQILQ